MECICVIIHLWHMFFLLNPFYSNIERNLLLYCIPRMFINNFIKVNVTMWKNARDSRRVNYPHFRGIIPIFMPQHESRYRYHKTSQNPDFHKMYLKKLLVTDFKVFLINFYIIHNFTWRHIYEKFTTLC